MTPRIITSSHAMNIEIQSGEDVIKIDEMENDSIKVKWQTMDNKNVHIELVNSNTIIIKLI